ncbi:sigma-70 family RNA polymerase sigma factor [soil metagenome]
MMRADDEALYEAIHAEHGRLLHAYLLGRTGDREAAADLSQETFLRAWGNIGTLRRMSAARRKAWLFAVARNLVIDLGRQATVRRGGPLIETPDECPSVERSAEGRDTMSCLDRAIRKLPDDLRSVLTLTVMEEMTSEEVGRLLQRPPGTVRYQLAEARRRLMTEVAL